MKHAPSDLLSDFAEHGYLFKAFRPSSEYEECVFPVNVSIQSTVKEMFSYSVPMLYASLFGVDESNRAALEAATNPVLAGQPLVDSIVATAYDLMQQDRKLKQLRVTFTEFTQ